MYRLIHSAIITLILTLWVGVINSANRVYIDDISIAAISSGQKTIVPLMIESDVDITSLQCDLYLPEGISVSSIAVGSLASESHFFEWWEGNSYTRIVCYSSLKQTFNSRSGDVALIELKIAGTVTIGSYTCELKNVYLSDAGKPAQGYDTDDTSFNISVEQRVLVESITLSSSSGTIGVGETLALQATISPDNAYNKEVTWSSSHEGVAVVDENGVVTGISMGSATITATAKDGTGKKATCTIYVEEYITFVDPNVESICLQYWDRNKNGRLSKSEISSVTTLGSYFNKTTAIAQSIRSFDELQYFIGLKTLNKYAFCGCTNLESITFPNTMTTMETEALYNCSSLKHITLPSSLINIGESALYNCRSLEHLTIPSTLTNIDATAFRGCSGLKSIDVESGNTRYDSRDNCNALILTSTNTLILGCENTVIPNSILSIGDYAFYNCEGLPLIDIPSSVTTIGKYAFCGCLNVNSIFIPTAVVSIASYAFLNCSSVSSIIVEEGNPIYDSRGDCNALIETSSNTLLRGCKNTVIPNTVTTLGTYAFGGCGDLNTIEIPGSVTTINPQAFSNSGLINITLPNSITSLGNSAFARCKNLKDIVIPSQITAIGGYMFFECTALETVVLGDGVVSIGDNAFNGCINLKEINIPANVTTINKTAFTGCSDYNVFINSQSLVETNYSSSSGNNLSDFFGRGVKKYTIGEAVTKIGNYAFYQKISTDTKLQSVVIPSTVTSIGKSAFSACKVLTDVTVNWETPLSIATADNVFQSVDLSKATLHVPFGTENAYKSKPVWKDFGNIVALRPVATDVSTLSDAVYLESFTVSTGTTIEIPINLKNEQTACAYQFDLELPDGVSVAKNAKGKYIASLSDRHDGHSMSSSLIEDNTYRFAVLSFSGDEISGNDGEIINITLQVDDDTEGGEYLIYIKNAAYSTPAGTSISLPMTTSIVTIEDVTLGDVNKDGKIDIADAVGIVNFILNKASTTFVEKASDVNKDGRTDIADAVAIINIILNK